VINLRKSEMEFLVPRTQKMYLPSINSHNYTVGKWSQTLLFEDGDYLFFFFYWKYY